MSAESVTPALRKISKRLGKIGWNILHSCDVINRLAVSDKKKSHLAETRWGDCGSDHGFKDFQFLEENGMDFARRFKSLNELVGSDVLVQIKLERFREVGLKVA